MLTRGYFIGEIVDGLSDIAGQVSTRGRLGLTDLNKHAEDFFGIILNYLLSISLLNLNAGRSNEPGLDLGDKVKRVAFQITATRTSAKVNDTLAALSDDQIQAYTKIRVLVIGRKQLSYTLDAKRSERACFSAGDIWDIDDLCKLCMDLRVDVLQLVYNHFRRELARIKIELEIPDVDGKYPTTLADFIEGIPKPRISDLVKFNKVLEIQGIGEDLEKTQNAFATLSAALTKLPRITREFLVMMIERRETERKARLKSVDHIEINADKLARISRYPDNDGELRLLDAFGFVRFDEPDQHGECAHWRIFLPGLTSEGRLIFLEFAEKKGITLSRALVALDFSDF